MMARSKMRALETERRPDIEEEYGKEHQCQGRIYIIIENLSPGSENDDAVNRKALIIL